MGIDRPANWKRIFLANKNNVFSQNSPCSAADTVDGLKKLAYLCYINNRSKAHSIFPR